MKHALGRHDEAHSGFGCCSAIGIWIAPSSSGPSELRCAPRKLRRGPDAGRLPVVTARVEQVPSLVGTRNAAQTQERKSGQLPVMLRSAASRDSDVGRLGYDRAGTDLALGQI